MDARSVGLLIALVGAAAVIVGLLLASGALGWFGHLPGDIRIETENARIYVPITSMLLVSATLSIAAALARRFF